MRRFGNQGIVALTLFVFLFVTFPARAQTTPVATPGYNARMNQAVNGVIAAKLKRWGFAANDPRFNATATGVSTGLSVIAGVLMAGGVAVSWPVLLTAAGIAGLVSGAITLAGDPNYKWTFLADGKIIATGTKPGAVRDTYPGLNGNGGPLVAGGFYYEGSISMWDPIDARNKSYPVRGTSAIQVASIVLTAFYGAPVTSMQCSGYYPVRCTGTLNGRPQQISIEYFPSGAPNSSANGLEDTRPPIAPVTLPPTTYNDATEAIKVIPDSEKEKVVSAEVLAAAVNAAWKSAASSNETGGIPWSASDPVTPAEVSAWMKENPTTVPTVGDFFAPANAASGSSQVGIGNSSSGGSTSPGGGGSPNPGTGTQPQPEPSAPPVTPGEGEQVDWGPDPNIGAPILEQTPTASSILDPIFGLMPDLKGFTVPAHAAECPTASFDVLGSPYVMDSHCGLLDANRAVIAAAMMLLFSLASLFVVLKA